MAATIDILTSGGSARYTAVLEPASVRHFELMKEDYVRLVFKAPSNIGLDMGDKVTVDGTTYVITTPQNPTINKNTGGYEYDVQFDAYYWAYNNKLLKFIPESQRNEVSFSLTDNLKHHLSLVSRNIAAAGGSASAPAIGGVADADKNIYIHYDGLHIIDALTHICEVFHCEWWFEGDALHIGKAQSNGTPIPLTLGVNVEDMGSEKGNRELVTRIYAFGSTRNIPFDYRSGDQEVTLNGVVQKRLMLPKGTPYVQIQTVSDSNSVEGLVFFEDIYPRMENHITDLDIDDREVETTQESAAGEETVLETVPIYRFKDSSLTFRESYLLAGQTLQVQFQSGRLNGMVFDLAFNPDGEPETIIENGQEVINPDAQWFEIVRNDTYGLMLPNDVLRPDDSNGGDEFVLLGWDVRSLASLELIEAAENELYTRAQSYLQTLQTDPNVYPCTMMADYMFGLDGSGHQDPAYSKVGAFPLGTPVTLSNGTLFQGGTRNSRVIGWEFKLDKPYDGAILYVGDTATYSSKKATSDSIQGVKNDVNYKLEGMGNGMNESQFSILLQSYGAKMFLSKTAEDVAAEKITFLKGIELGIGGAWGFVKQIVENGSTVVKAWFANLQANILQVLDHIKGPLLIKGNTVIAKDDNNQGGTLSVAGDTTICGKLTAANAEILNMLTTKNLTVTGLAHFFELVIDKIKAAGGAVLVTPANGFKVEIVEHVSGGYKLYWSAEDDGKGSRNMWKENDQAICQNFNGARVGTTFGEGNKYYWALVTDVSGDTPATVDGRRMHWIVISTSVCVGDPSKAEVGDEIAMLGYRGNDDAPRQSAIYLAAYNSLDSDLTAPLLAFYKGINDFDLKSHRTTYIDAQNAVFKGRFLSTSTSAEGIDIEALLSGSEFDIIYGFGNPNTVSPAPHATWTTPAMKLLHVGTLYFDLDLEPASEGGRLYRWQQVESGAEYNFGGYAWVPIADIDTLSALDKIADVASDGKLTGGAEKMRVYLEWMDARKTYDSLWGQMQEHNASGDWTNPQSELTYKTGVTFYTACNNFNFSFFALATYLNNKTDWTLGQTIPAWIDPSNSSIGMNVTTVLPAWLNTETPPGKAAWTTGALAYRGVWADFYESAVEMTRALNAWQFKEIDEMGDDGFLDPEEKASLRQIFSAEVQRYFRMLDDFNSLGGTSAHYDDTHTLSNIVIAHLNNLGTYLDGEQLVYMTTTVAQGGNPSLLCLFEYDSETGGYKPTEDISVVSGKTYYKPEVDEITWEVNSEMREGLTDEMFYPATMESGDRTGYPRWLLKENETQSQVVEDKEWDYFWNRYWQNANLMEQRIALAKQYQIDNLDIDLPTDYYTRFSDSGATPASKQEGHENLTPRLMPNGTSFKDGDRWYEEIALINPVTKDLVFKDSNNQPLYNIYVCKTAYTSSSYTGGYDGRFSKWELIFSPISVVRETGIDSIYDAVFGSDAFAYWTMRIDAIESVVSALGASKNMLLNGDFSEVSSYSYLAHFSSSGLAASPQRYLDPNLNNFDYYAAATIAANSAGNGKGLQMTTNDQPCLYLKSGRSYILSVWMKSPDSNLKICVLRGGTTSTYEVGDMTVVGGSSKTLTSSWQRFSVVITGDDSAKTIYLAFRYSSTSANAVGTVHFAGIQLEEGTEVTDWMSGDGNPIVLSSQIKQTATEITAYVKKGTKVGGIKIDSSKVTIYGDSTEIQGDLDVKGLITNAATLLDFTDGDDFVDIDLSSVKSIVVKTIGDVNDLPTPAIVALPTTTALSADGFSTVALNRSGVMLSITHEVSMRCRDWAKPSTYSSTSKNYFLQRWDSAVAIVADARLLTATNYFSTPMIEPCGKSPLQISTSIQNVFVCNGYYSKILMLAPGQTVTLISSVEDYNGTPYLAWYVQNSAQFGPVDGAVSIAAQNSNADTYNNVFPVQANDYYGPIQLLAPPTFSTDASLPVLKFDLAQGSLPVRELLTQY